jgi:hypothetical protein
LHQGYQFVVRFFCRGAAPFTLSRDGLRPRSAFRNGALDVFSFAQSIQTVLIARFDPP